MAGLTCSVVATDGNTWHGSLRGGRGAKNFFVKTPLFFCHSCCGREVALLEDEPPVLKEETMRINGKIRL